LALLLLTYLLHYQDPKQVHIANHSTAPTQTVSSEYRLYLTKQILNSRHQKSGLYCSTIATAYTQPSESTK